MSEPCHLVEGHVLQLRIIFWTLGSLVGAIANAIQSALRPAPRNTLDIVSSPEDYEFFGNEEAEKSEIWFDHVEKTFRIME